MCSKPQIKKPALLSQKPFVQVSTGVFIRKTTAVWLFQEGERVSSDRLFRVRTKQPFSSNSTSMAKSSMTDSELPTTSNVLHIGDVCVFKANEDKWSIGKVLQFSRLNHKNTQQYKQYSRMELSPDIGVLCSWFEVQKGSTRLFKLFDNPAITHTYIPTSHYICTLNNGCIDETASIFNQVQSILPQFNQKLATAKQFLLTKECECFVNNCLMRSADTEPPIIVHVSSDSDDSTESTVWKKIACLPP